MSGKGAKGLAGGKGAKVKGTGDKKKPVSRSVKAGLQFPVGRIHRFLKARIRAQAPSRGRAPAPGGWCLPVGQWLQRPGRAPSGPARQRCAPRGGGATPRCRGAPGGATGAAARHFFRMPRPAGCPVQERSTANGRVGATAAVYSAAILGALPGSGLRGSAALGQFKKPPFFGPLPGAAGPEPDRPCRMRGCFAARGAGQLSSRLAGRSTMLFGPNFDVRRVPDRRGA